MGTFWETKLSYQIFMLCVCTDCTSVMDTVQKLTGWLPEKLIICICSTVCLQNLMVIQVATKLMLIILSWFAYALSTVWLMESRILRWSVNLIRMYVEGMCCDIFSRYCSRIWQDKIKKSSSVRIYMTIPSVMINLKRVRCSRHEADMGEIKNNFVCKIASN